MAGELPITLLEYERLFRTIHGILLNEEGTPSRACLFFAILGAAALNRHHRFKSPAQVVSGAAAHNLRTPTNACLVLGASENDELVSDKDHFHCWIEVEGWIVDFSAPLFDQMLDRGKDDTPVPPLMFQKRALSTASMLERLGSPGAYLHIGNQDLTFYLLDHFSKKRAHGDLVEICTQWYTRPPKKIRPALGIGNAKGEVSEVPLSSIRIAGAW